MPVSDGKKSPKKTAANITPPRSIKRKVAKDKIFDAAMKLLKEYGYDYITVNNICEMSGISTGNFYHYFESKDALMSNFFIVAYEQFLSQHEEVSYEDPIEDIIAFFCSYADFCEEQGLEFVQRFYSPTNKALKMEVILTPAEDHFALPALRAAKAKFVEGQERGIFDPDADAATVANDICTIEKGAIFEWCVSEGTFKASELTRRLLTQYLKSYLL